MMWTWTNSALSLLRRQHGDSKSCRTAGVTPLLSAPLTEPFRMSWPLAAVQPHSQMPTRRDQRQLQSVPLAQR